MEELLIKRKKPAKKKQHSARREAAETDNSQQSTDSGDATTASPSSAPTTSSTATQQQPTAPPLHSPLQLPQQTKWQQQQEETNLMDQAEAHIQPTISQLDLLRPQVNPDTVTSIYPEHIGDSSAITLPDTSTSAALVNIDKSEVLSMVSAPALDSDCTNSQNIIAYDILGNETNASTYETELYPSLPPPTLTTSIQPSAPFILQHEENRSLKSLASTTKSAIKRPQQQQLILPEEVLLSLYPFTLPQEYSSIVAEFLGSSSNLSKAGDDLFYFKVQEYEKLLASIQSLKRELHTLQINSKLEISKIWVMKRESKSVVSSCKDGIEISHTVNSEIAHFEEEPVRELEASFEKIRHESHVNLSSLQFKVKLAKLWIQNYVDEMLELYYDDESAFSKSRGKDHVKSSGVLENTLDILFYFERRITNRIVSAISSSTDSTKKNNSSSSLSGASGLSDYESDAKDSSSSGMFSLFTRDIRGWITHIASFLLLKRPLEYNVYILLHCLRTPGIGTWGSSFVQWSMERYYQSGLFFTMAGFENMKPGLKMVYPIECYLLSLKYLFSSLLEKEEQRQLYLFEKLHIRESLKHLEKNSDWIVLDDDQLKQDVNYKSKDPIEVLVLTDQDYLSLLNQFSLEETWDHIIQHWKGRLVPYIAARYSAGASDTGLSNEMVAGILEIFAQYTHFVGILSRCSDSFDLNRYPKMSRRVGECLSKMLVKLTNVFQDSGLESLVSQCNEEYIQRFVTPSRLMKDLITVTTNSSSAVVAAKLSRTSLESEMERTILITMKAFLDFDEGTWWKFLKYLPVSQLSLETRQRVLVNYNSYSSSSSSSSSSTSSLSNVIPSENDNLLHLLKTRVGEAHLVLEFFSNLALQPIVDNFATNNNNDNTQTSSALVQQQQQQEMLIQMASAIFKNCYVSWASLYEGVSETTEKLEAIKSNLFISRKLIKDMCVLFPALQAFIITWIREILSTKNRPDTLKMALLKLIKELPLNLWRPSQDELEMILDMLKDPDSEFHKYAIGRWVLQSLSWGQNDDLPIPRYYHRIVAFTLCNICLDRGIVKEVSPPANSTASKGVLGTVGHVAYETVHLAAGAVNIAAGGVGSIVGSAAGVVGSKTKELIDWSGFGTSEFDEVHALGLDDHDFDFINVAGVKGVVEDEFVSWCWRLFRKLALYHRPTSQNTYSFSDGGPFLSKPFESINSPSLATLRGSMFINPLAAYVILMVSEIGHSLQTFNNNNGEGWRLLRVLMNGGKFDQVIRVSLEIMPTFLKSSQHQYGDAFINPQILEEENFALFWREFWTRVSLSPRALTVSGSASNPSLTSSSFTDFKNVFSVSLYPLFAAEHQSERDVYVIFWVACACGDSTASWISSRSRVRILDMLFEIALSSFHQNRVYGSSFEKTLWEIVCDRIGVDYHKMLEAYAKLNPSSSSAYSVIGWTSGTATYPSLIGGSTNSSFSSAPSALPSLIQQLAYSSPVKIEKECLWFAMEALKIEMNKERNVRELIGQQLSKDSSLSLQEAMKQVYNSFPELQKPLLSFTIVKLAHHIISINAEHPLLVIFSQLFFVLFFQKTDKYFNPNYSRFGYRFLSDQRDLLDRLETSFVAMSKCYHSCTRSDLQRLQLHSLFNAMALWIKDARLRSSSTSVESLPSTFETARLKSCFEAICLKENRRPWEGLWIDLINIEKSSAALKALVSAAADVGSSCDDDHVPRESFITATTTGEAIGMYESMESSKSAPPHARRIPAILSLEAMTFDDVNQIFSTEKSGDMHSLISKSQTFKKAYQRNVELDSEFLEKLQQLYRNEQRKSRYEKNCIPTSISLISAYSPIRVPGATRKPGSCTGPAVFDCKINEVIMVSEIRSYLDMNREEVGGILTGEQVDHLCCIIVLKILRGCAWLCLNRERDGVKNERVASLAIKSVYSLLAVLEGDYSSWYAHAIGIEQYPPLFAVVEKILTTLVEAFISNSDVESFRLFQRFIVFSEKLPSLGQAHASGFIGKPLELLAAKFNPVAIGKLSSYSQLYRQAALCIPRLGSVISTPFLLQFGSCNESIAMSDEEKLEYLSTLLNLIDSCSASTDKEARHQHVKEEEEEVGRGLKEKCGADDYLCALHHQNLKRFLEANKTSYFTSALTNILKGLVDFTETASEAILADVLEVLTENSVSREWWKTVLIDSEFVHMGIQGANNLMSIIEVISSQFLEQSSNHSLVHKKAIHKSILRLLVVCNLGQPLNMIRSEIQMIEWRQSLKNVLFLWLGVFISPPLDEGGLDDFELVSEIVHAFARISIKQNQAWGVMNQCPWIIWDWYSTLIKEYVTNPIWKPVVVVFETELVKLESVWDRMVWNYGMTMVVLGWWDSLSLTTATLSSSSTTHVKTFLMWLFEKTMFATVGNTISPTPFPDTVSESVFDTLRLLCLMIVQMDESFAGNHEARSSFLASLDSKGLQVTWIQCCSCSELSRLISCLPTEWNCRGMLVSSVQDNDSCCLGILLRLLRKCAGITENQPSTVIDSLQKCGKYVEFILNLIQKQVQDPYDSGSIFNLDSFGDVVGEVLLIVDSLHHQDSTVPTLLETALHHSFFILNNCKIGSKSGKCFWEGLVRFTSRVTRFPARILKQACHTIASTEQMSLIVEMCIERQHRLEGGETSGPFAWDRITSILVVPELEEEAFVRHSLNHALIMTLFCHILQKLDACQGNQDLRILMGQQVATWITMINIEASSFTTTTSNNALAAVGNTEVAVVAAVITSSAAATAAAPSTGGYNERKMILLLSQFALLLSEELSSLPLPENHSRLRGHLPKVAEVLLKWSEDRASQGLWATLGMGPKSSLSIEFRFFARAVGTFISTRLLVKQQQQHRTASILSTESSTDASSIIYKENEHTSKLIEELNAFGKSYEATLGGSGALGEVARFLENHEKGIHELYAFIATLNFLIPEFNVVKN